MSLEPRIQAPAADIEQELSDFSYIVSHDLAAVCRHMAQFSDLLVREMGDNLTDTQKTFITHIQAAGGKCQAMMEELLVYSRMQQRELKVAPLDVRQLLDTAMLHLNAQIRASGAEIVVGPVGVARGDRDLMIVVIKHILDNALKFRRHDCAPRIEVTASRTRVASVLRFADNGIGLAPDLRDRAFRMFWQLSAQRGQPGVGAGLAICRRIVRRHGGDMRFVDSERGACLELVLPGGESVH